MSDSNNPQEEKKDLMILKRRDYYYIIGETIKGKHWLYQNVHGGYKGFVVIQEEFIADHEALWLYEGLTVEYCICHPKLKI